jgi:chromosome segregation ATPase
MAVMTYAEALGEAKAMILKHKDTIRHHEGMIREQKHAIAERDAELTQRQAREAELQTELGAESARRTRLEGDLEAEKANREHAGRQRVQIDQMEQKAAELNATIERQESLIDRLRGDIDALQAELEATRAQLPTDADKAALRDIADLLKPASAAKADEAPAAAKIARPEAPEPAPFVLDDSATEADKAARNGKKDRKSVFCFRQAA